MQHETIYLFASQIDPTGIKYLQSDQSEEQAACKRGKRTVGATLLKGLKIISAGMDNEIVFGDFARIKNCTIIIRGNRNRVTVGDGAILDRVELCMEDSGNEIRIGNKTEVYGNAHLAAIEGTKILIGDNCLFSSDLHIRTGDSHSVLNMDGKRINHSSDVVIEDHVWIGTKVTCLKGVRVMEDSVVAATTTLCKQYGEKNAVIGWCSRQNHQNRCKLES